MHVSVTPLFLTQLLKHAVRGVKGQELGGVGSRKRLAELEKRSSQIQEECIRSKHLEEYLGHLVRPDFSPPHVGLQAATQPREQQVASFAGLLK